MSNFQFNDAFSGDMYSSLFSLTKFNNGLFKSEKQKNFLMKQIGKTHSTYDVTILEEGEQAFVAEYCIRWVDYGSRSVIPGAFIVIVDQFGVNRIFKLPYKGNLRDGAYPDPSRATLKYSRPTDVVIPEYLQQKEVASEPVRETKYLGTVGDRVKLVGVVKSIREFQTENRSHYYDNGQRTVTTVAIGDSEIVYWNALGDAKKGDKVKFACRVKSHNEYNGVKQTVVSRATQIEVIV